MSEPKLGPSPAQITMMGHNIQAQIDTGTRRRTRQIRGAAVGIGVALVVGASVTAAALAVRPAAPEDVRYAVDCYTAPDPTSEFARNLFVPGANDDVPFGEEFALLICANAYARQQVVVRNPTVCELADLRLGVFPNDDDQPAAEFCLAIGLTTPPE